MDIQTLLTKKRLAIISLFIIFICLTWFLFSYSWITITNSSDTQAQIAIVNQNGTEQENFVLNERESKSVLLNRDSYIFRVSGDDKFSLYKKPLGFLWFNELDVELKPQKASVFIGKSHQPCVKEKNNETFFSSCGPIGEGNFLESDKRGMLGINQSNNPGQSSLYEGILKNYNGAYLHAYARNGELLLTKRDISDVKNKPLVVKKFTGTIDSNSVATAQNSDTFAVYNNQAKTVLVFKDTNDSNPLEIKLPKDKLDSHLNIRLAINNNYVYIVGYDGEPHGHGDEEEGKIKPRILTYNIQNGEEERDYSIPPEWLVREVVTGFDDKVLFNILNLKESSRELYLIQGDSKPSVIKTVAAPVQNVCWKDKNDFYYLADGGKNIYLYSFTQQASFLVYGGLNNKIISAIQCLDSTLYFNFDLMKVNQRVSNEDKGYYHYRLNDEDFRGSRIEGVLPLYVNVGGEGGSTVKVTSQIGGVLRVENVTFYGEEVKTPNKQTALKAVKEKLEEEGVDTGNLRFNLQF